MFSGFSFWFACVGICMSCENIVFESFDVFLELSTRKNMQNHRGNHPNKHISWSLFEHKLFILPQIGAYIYIYRRLGGRPLPGNRFVSFVRAYARCPLPSGNEPQNLIRGFPFSLEIESEIKVNSLRIQCELKVNSKWKQCEILPPPPNPPIQLRLAFSDR